MLQLERSSPEPCRQSQPQPYQEHIVWVLTFLVNLVASAQEAVLQYGVVGLINPPKCAVVWQNSALECCAEPTVTLL